MYQKVDSSLDFTGREEKILEFWRENQIFEKQIRLREDGEVFTFYDGPPTANGKPHIGHILTRAIKDSIPRYQSMKGKNVLRKAGWDTHGLPVELEVEKQLGINGKEQIEAYGIEPFTRRCKESVWKYKKEWEEMSERVGYWVDMDDPYVTYEDPYIESEWWAISEIAKRGLLYQGHKILPYCPRCGTALASHEVAQGYKDVKEMSIYVRFAVKGEDKCWFSAWTTTPWTLPSNISLTVHPDVDYVLCEREEADGPNRYYVAKDLAEKVLGEDIKVIREMKGRELEGMEYEPILPYAKKIVEKSPKKAYIVTLGNYVTTTDGTGIVHTAPAFGEDDATVGAAYDLCFVQLLDDKGCLPEETEEFAGLFCKKADPGIIEKLEREGKLLKKELFEHNYPFCWRCDTPLIYYARGGWFVRMTELREALLESNSHVNWIPKSIGEGRFGNFLDNVNDWAISRERYWGMPLPIWQCECGHWETVGSVAELREKAVDCPEELELHRPYVDRIHLKCPKCGKEMSRIPEVIDCWFDSGSMPFAQWHYPFENKEMFESHFPADFISEAVDQTRGWFYSLTALSTLLFGKEAFENCIVLGLVQDEDGKKMSKSKGNAVDPWSMLEKEGADAVRWYFYSNSQPWLPSRFSEKAVEEGKRKFMGTLWNTYAFFVLYADIDKFEPKKEGRPVSELQVMDRWILSRLNSLVKKVDSCFANYDITGAARSLEAFTDELSNWYIRRGRERYWVAGMPQDKEDAYQTLWTVLVTVAQLAAPLTPFLAEEIYQNLVAGHIEGAPESIHLTDFPVADLEAIDPELEEQMAIVLELVTLGRTARNESGLKTRQPLSRMLVVDEKELLPEYARLCADELNVKKLEWTADASALQDYQFKPQLRLLGKRFGKRLPELKKILSELDGVAAWRELSENGALVIEMADGPESLAPEELLVEAVQSEGFASASDHGVTVALDTTLTEELIEEGMLREIVSKVQTMRKEAGFEVTDRITLSLSGNERLEALAGKFEAALKDDVLAEALLLGEMSEGAYRKEWDINGEALEIGVER